MLLKCIPTLYMRERLTKTTTTHCYIIIRRFTLLYIQDFGGGTLGHRPTINLPTFIRGRRSHAFLASIILYATSSVPPYICIYRSPLYPEGFPKNSGPRLYMYIGTYTVLPSRLWSNRGPLSLVLLFIRHEPNIIHIRVHIQGVFIDTFFKANLCNCAVVFCARPETYG